MSDPRAKIEKLLTALDELDEKRDSLKAEIRALVSGDEGIGAKMKAVRDAWSLFWQDRYHTPYVWQFAKDNAQIKRLLKSMDVDELRERFVVYLGSSDPFFVKGRHSFGMFVATVNQHTPRREVVARPAGCAHEPPCKSDAAHTSRCHYEVLGEGIVSR